MNQYVSASIDLYCVTILGSAGDSAEDELHHGSLRSVAVHLSVAMHLSVVRRCSVVNLVNLSDASKVELLLREGGKA